MGLAGIARDWVAGDLSHDSVLGNPLSLIVHVPASGRRVRREIR